MQLLLIHVIEVVYNLEQVFFDQLPTVIEKGSNKAIWSWGFVFWSFFDYCIHFSLSKGEVKMV
jgi:hypothetical protein